ncbi:OLC1v1014198C1 [Oldenlandia corymbosa var. corymbosa]|uniref:OLC1v1014198C1 n=1 Tax=Oldenlandia corymbosa var. corymbosa TaxID=529605 RepID=A0AAV1E052_OLDCO|nr:OLC1v1014198C1 [Oldenlandia corymbosa var. corymbosa]
MTRKSATNQQRLIHYQVNFESVFNTRDNLSMTEATELAKKALCVGAYSAHETGGFVSGFHVGSVGIAKMFIGAELGEWQEEHYNKFCTLSEW